MTERLLTPEEAAERLAVSPKGVKNWLRQGLLRGLKVGRLWRISEGDLSAFIAASRVRGRKDAVEQAWLESDLSELGSYEAYDWGPNGPPQGAPVRYVAGEGLIVEDET